MNLHSKILIFYWLLGAISKACLHSPRDILWPMDLHSPFPYRTPSPIYISSSQVKFAPPATITITFNAGLSYLVTNTGSAITVTPVHANTQAEIEGGYFKNPYMLENAIFNWAPNSKSAAGIIIDGVGAALQCTIYYRNLQYPSSEEALNYRDGYVKLIATVRVGLVPNILFESFRQTLEGPLKKAGSSVLQSGASIFLWLASLPFIPNTYVYPGSHKGKDCTTDVTPTLEYQSYISESQFQAFLGLLNEHGVPYSNPIRASPSGCRPISQGQSLVVIPLYIDSPLVTK